MNLLIRLNIVLIITFALAAWIAHAVCVSFQQSDASRASGAGVGRGTRVFAEELRKLEIRLARIMGPIAGILVDRAAAVAADFGELERRLAAGLESPEDQRRFLQTPQ